MLFASFIIMFKKSQIILVTKDHRKKKKPVIRIRAALYLIFNYKPCIAAFEALRVNDFWKRFCTMIP